VNGSWGFATTERDIVRTGSSAHASAEIAAAARAMGAFDILPKPFDLDGCEQTLRQAHSTVRR